MKKMGVLREIGAKSVIFGPFSWGKNNWLNCKGPGVQIIHFYNIFSLVIYFLVSNELENHHNKENTWFVWIFFISFLNGVLGEICKKSGYFTNFARKSDSSFPKNSLFDFKIANLPPYYPGVTKKYHFIGEKNHKVIFFRSSLRKKRFRVKILKNVKKKQHFLLKA